MPRREGGFAVVAIETPARIRIGFLLIFIPGLQRLAMDASNLVEGELAAGVLLAEITECREKQESLILVDRIFGQVPVIQIHAPRDLTKGVILIPNHTGLDTRDGVCAVDAGERLRWRHRGLEGGRSRISREQGCHKRLEV